MLSSIYTALSGMLGFSKGLDVLGNNVANMNTPGFKAGELRFNDLFYRYGLGQGDTGAGQVGQGVGTGSTRTKFGQGELRATNNAMDAAIDGNGFFILQKDGQTFYTRNGQFEFNDEGILVDQDSKAHVMAFTGGRLTDIRIAGLRVDLPQATSRISFTGMLDINTTSHQINNVTVIDSNGTMRTLSVSFTLNNSPALIGSALSTTDTVSSLNLDTNEPPLSTTRTTTTTTNPAFDNTSSSLLTNRTFTNPATTYTVQTGDTWDIIALSIYGASDGGEELATALGFDPSTQPTAGADLSSLPASLTVNVDPYYTVTGTESWDDIASLLYGGVTNAGDELATALGLDPLIDPVAGAELSGFPATLAVTVTTTQTGLPPFYLVQSGDTWNDIALLLYGSADAGDQLATQLGFDPAVDPVADSELANLPSPFNLTTPITITVPPYYVVQPEDNSWDAIGERLYGAAGLGAQLEAQFSSVTLATGARLDNFPPTLAISGQRWTIAVSEGTTAIGSGEIRYAGTTQPINGFDSITINYNPAGAANSSINLDFSNSTSGSTSGSTLAVGSRDGFTSGSLIESSFDENGALTLKYSNSQTRTREQLALAWFQDLQGLTLVGGNLFTSRNNERPIIATAKSQGMGAISPKHVELSNVELTEQFTDMVVIQRGYQASSQIISVANEMAQQLMDLRGRR